MIILDRNSSETARSYAMRVLLYNIIHVELQPGSAVSENELSSALSLPRTPIREALIELNRIGLVEILPQRGSYISKINYAIVEESRFVRLVMETAVIKLACESITDDYLLALKQNIEQQKACQCNNHHRQNAFQHCFFRIHPNRPFSVFLKNTLSSFLFYNDMARITMKICEFRPKKRTNCHTTSFVLFSFLFIFS